MTFIPPVLFQEHTQDPPPLNGWGRMSEGHRNSDARCSAKRRRGTVPPWMDYKFMESGDSNIGSLPLVVLKVPDIRAAEAFVKERGFIKVPPQYVEDWTASGCPANDLATKGLMKVSQRGGTGDIDDSTTFLLRPAWKLEFLFGDTHPITVEWHLVKEAVPHSAEGAGEGSIPKNVCSRMEESSKSLYLEPMAAFKEGGRPLNKGLKEKYRIRHTAKDRTIYLIGDGKLKKVKKTKKPKKGKKGDGMVRGKADSVPAPEPKSCPNTVQSEGDEPLTYVDSTERIAGKKKKVRRWNGTPRNIKKKSRKGEEADTRAKVRLSTVGVHFTERICFPGDH